MQNLFMPAINIDINLLPELCFRLGIAGRKKMPWYKNYKIKVFFQISMQIYIPNITKEIFEKPK